MKITEVSRILSIAVKNRFNSLLVGPPGVGKSETVIQVAKELDYEVMISNACTSESIDYKGLPSVYNKDGEMRADFIPYGNLQKILNSPKNLLVFFDDLGHAPKSVMAPIMEIIQARQIDGKKISDKVSFVAATNPHQGNTGAGSIISPLLSRFASIIHVEPDADSWKKWAANKVPIELLAFLNFKPTLISNFDPADKNINNFACPRTIYNLAQWIKAGIDNPDRDLQVWSGCVGAAFATEFAAFYKTYKSLASLPERVILDPENAPVPDNQATLYALTAALAHKATEKNLDAILKYNKRIPKEFQVFFIKDATTKTPALMESDTMINWFVDNPNMIR